eukprot:Sspe_Gene.35263::Locus_17102_Transcript_1_1_Confidence_1.000_Length_797::g.35263::m.35263
MFTASSLFLKILGSIAECGVLPLSPFPPFATKGPWPPVTHPQLPTSLPHSKQDQSPLPLCKSYLCLPSRCFPFHVTLQAFALPCLALPCPALPCPALPCPA